MKEVAKLATRKKNTASNLTLQSENKPWYKKLWLVLSVLVGIVVAILTNGITWLQNSEKIPAELSRVTSKVTSWHREDEHWQGFWSAVPEGVVAMEDLRLSQTDLKIQLSIKSGRIDGAISNTAVCKVLPRYDYALVSGENHAQTAKLAVKEIVGGSSQTIATLMLRREKDVIVVTPESDPLSLFPGEARLAKSVIDDEGYKMFDGTCDAIRPKSLTKLPTSPTKE